MVKSLFDLCLSELCRSCLCDNLDQLPCVCKQKLIEFFVSHDQINSSHCAAILSRPLFGCNLTRLYFYLSEQLDDAMLGALTAFNQRLEHIAIIECPAVGDQGIINVTTNQRRLRKLELRGLRKITSHSLKSIVSSLLISVDLSGCSQIDSEGIFYLVFNNPSIDSLFLNNCRGLDDQALYDIADCIGENLRVLELDFLHNSKMTERGLAIENLSRRCPNMSQLSLCCFFREMDEYSEHIFSSSYSIGGPSLLEVDLYGNYFATLPALPASVRSIRLSVSGQEKVDELVQRLAEQRLLVNIHLQLSCFEEDAASIENANRFLCHFIPLMSSKITRLDITLLWLGDAALSLITRSIPNLVDLSLDVVHVNPYLLRRLFSGGIYSQGARLKSLKLCQLRITYRALFAIGRGAISLTELETSRMPWVDDRFLGLLAENCKALRNVNFNGCKYVTDKGLGSLARNRMLREVRIRGTSCTDKSLYFLAQFCPSIEWISYADYSGRPKFSEKALKCLRDSCIQRIIC